MAKVRKKSSTLLTKAVNDNILSKPGSTAIEPTKTTSRELAPPPGKRISTIAPTTQTTPSGFTRVSGGTILQATKSAETPESRFRNFQAPPITESILDTTAPIITTPEPIAPNPDPKPEPATEGEIKTEAAIAGINTQKKERSRRGRTSTILTSSQGVLSPVKTKRRTLLGS